MRHILLLLNIYRQYSITPCSTKYSKTKQQDNRRAEIVLSESKNTNWATLEKTRGEKFYAVYNSTSLQKFTKAIIPQFVKIIKPSFVVKKDIVAEARIKSFVIKKDTVIISKIKSVIIKKDNAVVSKVKPLLVDKDTLVVAKTKPVTVKKDTVIVAKVKPVVIKKDTLVVAKTKPVTVKKDTVIVAKVIPVLVKKDTIVKLKPILIKKDNILSALFSTNLLKKDKAPKINALPVASLNNHAVIVAKSVDYDDAELSKAEIVKALDSLAKLRIEQERIVEYLTKRINKKPIEIFVSSDSVTIELYDNAIHDKDSVSVIFNNKIIVDRQELKVNKPIKFKLKVDSNKLKNELIMVAENLGSEPPNTAVMFVTEKSGRRQQVMLSTDMTHNEVVYFIRIAKNL